MSGLRRVLWHDREPWFYTYRPGGFEGYVAMFSRRRLAPDLQFYASGLRRRCCGAISGTGEVCTRVKGHPATLHVAGDAMCPVEKGS